MAVSSLFGAAASFFYAISTLLGGAQNNAAIQKMKVQNFDSTPTHLIPRVSSFSSDNNAPSAIQSSSANSNNNTAIYAVQFEPMPPNLAYRPMVSTYNLYGSESTPTNISDAPTVDPLTLFPDVPASIRASSGRMLMPTGTAGQGVAYYDGETIATVFADENGNVSHCELLEVNHPEEQNKIIEKIGFHGMLNLTRACQSLDVKNVNMQEGEGTQEDVNNNLGNTPNPIANPLEIFTGKKTNMFSMISGILPDIATNYNDLDKCCRSHDLCPRKVLAFRSAYGLVNWSFYAKSHCECDTDLYNCLKRASVQNPTAEFVGNFYFNVLRVQCVDEENPAKCVQFDGFSCIKWENDESEANKLVFREVRRRFR